MKRRLKQTLPLLMGIAVLALGMGCGQGTEPGAPKKITLTFPHALNQEHPVHKAIVKFAEEVAAKSNGTMEIKIFPGSTIGNEQELVDNVAKGTNDLTKVSTTLLETKSELAKVYSFPYLFRDADHLWKVLDGEVGQELLDMAEPQGLKGLCYYDAGFRSFYTKGKGVLSLEDLQGRKIRTQKSPMMEKLVGQLGALPQAIAFSELYTAIDTGVVDGAENNIPSYYTEQHYKVAPFYSYDEHVAVPDIVLISVSRWNKLTPEQQQILQDAAKVSEDFQRRIWNDTVAENVKALEAAGVTFSHPDKKPFVDKVAPLYEEFAGSALAPYLEQIRAVQ